MSVTFSPAPEVEKIASELIRKHHTHLDDVEIRYVFRSEPAKDGDKTIFGKARKVAGLNAYLVAESAGTVEDDDEGNDQTFFVIEIAEPVWTALDKGQRVALVDHELCHCRTKLTEDGQLRLVVAPHDLEEFRSVVDRHGLWKPDIEDFVKAANHQMNLLDT